MYNGANSVHLEYRIVKHDTFDELPVLVSFITTDIDVGQGVATDLANLAVVIPGETNLSIKDGVIYDGSHTGPYHYGADINGSEGLPYGGYLGVAFKSKFDYAFFAPAPANDDIYKFATGVRYDLFGSALQTKLIINRQAHLTVKYVDTHGKELKSPNLIVATNDFPKVPSAPKINDYELKDTNTQIISPNEEVVTYTYAPQYLITVEQVDEHGHQLAKSKQVKALEGSLLRLKPAEFVGYDVPSGQDVVVDDNQTVTFVYHKLPPKPVETSKANKESKPVEVETNHSVKPNYHVTTDQKPKQAKSPNQVIAPRKQSLTNVNKYSGYTNNYNYVATQSRPLQAAIYQAPTHVNQVVAQKKERQIGLRRTLGLVETIKRFYLKY